MASNQTRHPASIRPLPGRRQILPATAGKEFAGTAGAVQALYEAYPYPQYQQLFVIPDAGDSLAYLAHRCHSPDPYRPQKILVAGCGTTQVVSTAASNPSAAVVGVDISRASLQIAERMAGDLGLKNLELRQEDILTFAGHDGGFDLIECYGVLHHTADPLLGLRNLARALAPGGLMSVMVYSQRVRHELGETQHLFRMLNRVRESRNGDPSLGSRMALAQRLVQDLAGSDSRLKTSAQRALELFRDDRTQFADAYVQPKEVRYTLDEVLELTRKADLKLVNFVREGEWDPAAYLDDPDLLRRVRSLPQAEIWRFCDVVGTPFYSFICCHASSAPSLPRPCLTDDALVLTMVPHPCSARSYPLRNNRVAGPLQPEPREGSTFVRPNPGRIRFRATLGEVDAPAIVLEYLRLADGNRSVQDIATMAARRSGTTQALNETGVAAAFRGLFGMTPFLAPDVTRCDGCPRRVRAELPRGFSGVAA